MRLTKEARDEVKKQLAHALEFDETFCLVTPDELDALIADSEELAEAEYHNDSETPVSEIMAIASDRTLLISPDAESGSGGTLPERIKAACELAMEYGRLREELDRVTKERDAWRADAERLRGYIAHKQDCSSSFTFFGEEIHTSCDCGVMQALESHNQMTK